MLNKVKRAIRVFLSRFETALPIGVGEFDSWAKDIIDLAQIPDNDSTRYALTAIILQIKSSQNMVPKKLIVGMLLKGAANQVASQVMYELKTKQAEAIKAEQEAAKLVEQQDGLQK